jgi:hypothetical protein
MDGSGPRRTWRITGHDIPAGSGPERPSADVAVNPWDENGIHRSPRELLDYLEACQAGVDAVRQRRDIRPGMMRPGQPGAR